MTEDEMVGWYQRLNGHEFEQAWGDGEEQASLECCSPWGYKELDTTKQLNYNNKSFTSMKTWSSHNIEFLITGIIIPKIKCKKLRKVEMH